jgi:hypothetical protein
LIERITAQHQFCTTCGSRMVFDKRETVYSPLTGIELPYSHWVCPLTINQLTWAVDNHDILPLKHIPE